MGADWRKYCRGDGLELLEDGVEVSFKGERRQRVRVEEADGALRIWAVILRSSATREHSNPALLAWQRNCASRLVGLRTDERGRLVGQAWLSTVGLGAQEFQLYVRTVAAECDRFEHLLTGRDTE